MASSPQIDASSPSPAKGLSPKVTFGDFTSDTVEDGRRIDADRAVYPTLDEAALMLPPKQPSPSKGRRVWKPLEQGRKRSTAMRSPAKSPLKKMQRVSRPPKPSQKAVQQVTRNLLSAFDEPKEADQESVSEIEEQVRVMRVEDEDERKKRREMLTRAKESEDPLSGFYVYDSDLDDPEATVTGF